MVNSGRVLNACSRSWHASLVTAGCEAREEAQGPMCHPEVTGKGKTGRVNVGEPLEASLDETSGDGSSTEEQGPPLRRGSGGWSSQAGHVSTTTPGSEEAPDTGCDYSVRNMKPRSGPAELTSRR